ncbi:MAG: flagellar filament capping protein FliD [Peptococcaceae bacterium]|nr:flagellar filament capping protein FliD [Peptococcaceae bacterium]
MGGIIMSTTMRITGLASGLDTEQWVSDLMKAQRMRLDSIKQKKQLAEWKQEDYRTINSSLMALRSTVSKMRLQSTYLTMKATSGNESVVKVSAGGTASPGVNTIKVERLATGAYVTSTAAMGSAADKTTLQTQFGLGSAEDITISVNGEELTVNTGTDSIYTLVSKINNLTKADGSSVGVKASYDAGLDRIFFTTTTTGSAAEISLSQVSGGTNLLALLKVDSYTYPVTGQNARFDLNGVTGLEQSSNEFTISGVTYTLVGTSTSDVTVQVTRDTDAIYESIKSFIEQYNTTLELITGELSEKRYKDYLPLTDDQREELSDEQEKKWEEKARSGILKGESLLYGTLTKIRSAMSARVDGIAPVVVDGKTVTHNSLSSIGITVSTYDYTDGKLYLKNDGADLKEALETDPEGVLKLFTQETGVDSETGIAQRLYDELNTRIDLIIDKAGVESVSSQYDDSFLAKQIRDYEEQIEAWEERLAEMEDRYYQQFTAMEQAIAQLNAQSQWLAQQFGQ